MKYFFLNVSRPKRYSASIGIGIGLLISPACYSEHLVSMSDCGREELLSPNNRFFAWGMSGRATEEADLCV